MVVRTDGVRPFWICTDCKKKVRLRNDGHASRHSGINRFGKPSFYCIGSLQAVTWAAKMAEPKR